MFEIDGEYYYIDFMAVDKLLNLNNEVNPTGGLVTETETKTVTDPDGKSHTEEVTKNFYRSKEVDGFRYQTIQQMLEMIMIEPMDDENKSGELHDRDFAFKISFNTLLIYGIIKTYEPKK